MFDNKDKIKIALPSKGRLRKDLDALFVSKNIKISNQTEDRNYLARIDGLDNLLIYFLSAKEITGRLDEGSIHLGLTCDDLVQEKKRKASNTNKAVKEIQQSQQQSTLGDIEGLSALKDDLDKEKK